MELNGSQIVLEVLKEQGVDTIFGYPGGTILNIFDELYKYGDTFKHILTAHEQGASRNKAPAEHAVQRIKPRAERLVAVILDMGQRHGLHRAEAPYRALPCALDGRGHQFQRIPRLTHEALSPPQRRLCPAFRTHICFFDLAGHEKTF